MTMQSKSAHSALTHNMGFYPWYVACILSLAHLVSMLDRYVMSVVVEPLKKDLLLTDTQLGMLTGLSFVILFTVSSIPLGRLADIANRKMIIFFGVLGWSLATIACGFADSFQSLFFARLLVGLGEASLLPAALSIIAAYFVKGSRTKGVAIFSIGASLGRATAFMGGGALIGMLTLRGGVELFGHVFSPWQSLFVIAGAIGVATTFLVLTIKEPARREEAKKSTLRGTFSFLLANKTLFARFFFSFSMILGVVMALAAWTVSVFVRKHGMSVRDASVMMGFASLIIGPIGGLVGGWFADFLTKRGVIGAQPLILAISLAAIAFGGLLMGVDGVFAITLLGYLIAYFAISMAGPSGFGGVQLITPEAYRGVVSSIFLCTYTLLGTGLGPLCVGLLSDYVVRDEALIARALAAAILLFAAAGIPVAMSVRRRFYEQMRVVE